MKYLHMSDTCAIFRSFQTNDGSVMFCHWTQMCWTLIYGMVIRDVEFSSGGTKLERFLPKNRHTQSKLLNFSNWCSGKLSKSGHHLSNKVV